MEYATVVAVALVIILLSVFINERKISKLIKENNRLAHLSLQLSMSGKDIAENQKLLIEILKDHFTEEEIDKMIRDKIDNKNMKDRR